MIGEIFTSKKLWRRSAGAGLPLTSPDMEGPPSQELRFALVSQELFRKVLSISEREASALGNALC